ncbi:hypothetical protein V6N13_087988 [Hibiscus sabdariffa]
MTLGIAEKDALRTEASPSRDSYTSSSLCVIPQVARLLRTGCDPIVHDNGSRGVSASIEATGCDPIVHASGSGGVGGSSNNMPAGSGVNLPIVGLPMDNIPCSASDGLNVESSSSPAADLLSKPADLSVDSGAVRESDSRFLIPVAMCLMVGVRPLLCKVTIVQYPVL